jgi:hypothetical protein
MSPSATTGTPLVLQGIEVPSGAINKAGFFSLTRRKRPTETQRAWAGLGQTDNIELKKADIISGLHIRFTGSLVVTPGTGTVSTTMRWPHDLAKAFRFTANGQSNLLNASGGKFKAREQMANLDTTDRGVIQSVGAGTVQNGTLSLNSEAWGVGAGVTAIAAGTYNVELSWYLPVAEDHKDLAGAIFAQTSSMDLTLNIDWATSTELFVLTSNATAVFSSGTLLVEAEKFSIPQINGVYVLPDLSMYHSIIQTRAGAGLVNGENEPRIIGQGAGKQLLRVFYQVWNGAGQASAPLVANASNYGPQGWRYGSNETPEVFQDGRSMRQWNERISNSDIGGVFGFLCHEFGSIMAFRDAIDMGQTSELRLLLTLGSGVALNSAVLEYVQETVFSAVKTS